MLLSRLLPVISVNRVSASEKLLNSKREKIYETRSEIGFASHVYWKEAIEIRSYNHFLAKMMPRLERFNVLYVSWRKKLSIQLRAWASVIERSLFRAEKQSGWALEHSMSAVSSSVCIWG